jgi:cell division septum initiation protein DivIVA
MQQLLSIPPFNQITTKQFIDAMNGIHHVQVNQFLARVTIRYEDSLWTSMMWSNFCSGSKDEALEEIITEALERFA